MNDHEDEIIAEIRRLREAHAESFGFDLKLIAADFQRQEREAGDPVVIRPPREPQQVPKRTPA